jgi:hypothetical protein
LLVLAACSRAPAGQPGATGATAGGSPVFAREAFAPPAGDAGGGELPVPTTADPAALEEILAAGAGRGAPTPPPRGWLVGTDTKVLGEAGAASGASRSAEAPRSSKIHVGKVIIEPGMSSPSVERAARAQIYWPLVQRCRDHEGAILPPEVVHLAFQLDRDGYVVPATIRAAPRDARFADAARCMARELSMATFRAPAAARGLPQDVSMDVPSVD